MTPTEAISRALRLASSNAAVGYPPFGAVILDRGVEVSEAANQEVQLLDVTAHAEVMAIRSACTYRRSLSLAGLTIYSSCAPCVMCAGAIVRAQISSVVYAAERATAEKFGFSDRGAIGLVEPILRGGGCQVTFVDSGAGQLPFSEWQLASE